MRVFENGSGFIQFQALRNVLCGSEPARESAVSANNCLSGGTHSRAGSLPRRDRGCYRVFRSGPGFSDLPTPATPRLIISLCTQRPADESLSPRRLADTRDHSCRT
nr:hypothetical protein FEE99_19450 [Pseudomonas sp. ef1]